MNTTTATQSREAAPSSAQNSRTTADNRTANASQKVETRRPAQPGRPAASSIPAIFAAPPGVLMNAFLRNPWTFIRYMQDEMDRDFPTSASSETAGARAAEPDTSLAGKVAWVPALEVFRRGTDLIVHAELPGLRTDDIDVSVQEDALVISGERKQPENAGEGQYRSERRYGFFQRAVALPEGVDEEKISASFSDGVLEVRVPLPEPEQKTPRKIKIS